jgi:hypothetical protein
MKIDKTVDFYVDMLGYGYIGKGVMIDERTDESEKIPSESEVRSVVAEAQQLGFALDDWDAFMMEQMTENPWFASICFLASKDEAKLFEQAIDNLHLPLKCSYIQRQVRVTEEYKEELRKFIR